MSSGNPFSDLFTSPRMYPWRIDLTNGSALFVEMNEASYRSSRFLDHRIVRPESLAIEVGLDKLLSKFQTEKDDLPNKTMSVIFHTGYCGSTLLSRCIEETSPSVVLREPDPLKTLALQKSELARNTKRQKEWEQLMRLFVFLCSRTFSPEQRPVVKSTSFGINLMPELLQLNSRYRAIFLHSPLKEVLLSTVKDPLRSDEARFKLHVSAPFTNSLFDRLGPTLEVDQLSDMQVIALLWCAYVSQYVALIETGEYSDQIRAIDFNQLLSQPVMMLENMYEFLGASIPRASIQNITSSDVWSTYSKAKDEQIKFGKSEREANLRLAYERHEHEIDGVLAWLHKKISPPFNLTRLPQMLTDDEA